MAQVSLLERREIEARIVGPIYRSLCEALGADRTREILSGVLRDLARQSGCDTAARTGGSTLNHLKTTVGTWCRDGAVELEVLRDDQRRYSFDVKRCKFAEMYERLGLKELGEILSCNRDFSMIEGFSDQIGLVREHTIMAGHSHCDFRYTVKPD